MGRAVEDRPPPSPSLPCRQRSPPLGQVPRAEQPPPRHPLQGGGGGGGGAIDDHPRPARPPRHRHQTLDLAERGARSAP